jgi:hypothetical protein
METDSQSAFADRPCPMLFIILPAFVGGLLWLCTLLNRFGM